MLFRPEHIEKYDDKANELADVAEEDERRHEGVKNRDPLLQVHRFCGVEMVEILLVSRVLRDQQIVRG